MFTVAGSLTLSLHWTSPVVVALLPSSINGYTVTPPLSSVLKVSVNCLVGKKSAGGG